MRPGGADDPSLLFHRLLDLDEPSRARLLLDIERDDASLADDLRSLLEAHGELEPEFLTPPSGDPLTGTTLAGHHLLRRLGQGGTGVVFEAAQERPKRTVALKVVRLLSEEGAALRRLEREADVMAGLDHPNIAHVYDTGIERTPGGTFLWISMELVEGGLTLTRFAEEAGLDVEARLALFETLCDAVQYGHERAILHRDLKPENILVDPEGRLKLIDFGIAKALEPEGPGEQVTLQGDLLGTLAYLSPEVRAGGEASSSSEVYALGIVLYELLCGQPAFPTRGESISKVLAILESHRPARPRRVRPGLGADLEVVMLSAIAQEPQGRYATVSALAEDVRRVRSHRPILAQPPGPLHQAALFARRHRVGLAAVLLVFASLVAATLVSVRSARVEQRAAREALQQAYVGRIAAASAALRTFDAGAARYHLDQAPEELRGWEWDHYDGRADDALAVLQWPNAYVLAGAFSSRASIAAANASGPEGVALWDLSRREFVARWPRERGVVTACAVSPDGDVVAAGRKDGTLSVCTPEGAELQALTPAEAGVEIRSLAFSPDGTLLVAGDLDGGVTAYELEHGGRPRRLIELGDAIHALAFPPSGDRVYVGGGVADPRIVELDVASARTLADVVAHRSNVESLAVSPDGELVASCSLDGLVKLWSADLRPVGTLSGHSKGVKSVAFSPDGQVLASAGLDNTVRCWDPRGLELLRTLVGHSDDVQEVGFDGATGELVSLSRSGLRLWGDPRRQRGLFLGMDRAVSDLCFLDADGRACVEACSVTGLALRWDRETREVVARLGAPGGERGLAWFSPSGRQLFRVGPDRVLRREALGEPGSETEVLRFDRMPIAHATGDEGRLLVTSGSRWVGVVELATGTLRQWATQDENAVFLGVHPHAPRIVWASNHGAATLAEVDGSTLQRREFSFESGVSAIAFDAPGDQLALGLRDGGILLVDPDTLATRTELRGHGEGIKDLAFSPDGTRLASASLDGTVRVWICALGAEVAVLEGHRMHSTKVLWSPDGTQLLSGGGDWFPEASEVRLWRGH